MTISSPEETKKASAADIASAWLQEFEQIQKQGSLDELDPLFAENCWWRDLLSFHWDLRALQGVDAIRKAMAGGLEPTAPSDLRLSASPAPAFEPGGEVEHVTAYFELDTAVGTCRGYVRLVPTPGAGREWGAWLLLTALYSLRGFEERTGPRREWGNDFVARVDKPSWAEVRAEAQEFADREPEVLVVGGGHSGLMLATRLGLIDVDTLVVESNGRVGDNWRNRYPSLILHDPVWMDHLPYLNFPPNWPVFTPKDKYGDWLEIYAQAMELNVWTGTKILSTERDKATGTWTVRLSRSDGSERVIRPKHLVLATGLNGRPRLPEVASADDFKGTIVHSGDFPGGEAWKGGRAVVVGAGVSGHDVCQDLYQQGVADITLVQRSSTYVVRSETYRNLFLNVFAEDGAPAEDVDVMAASAPWPLIPQLHVPLTEMAAEIDAELLDGLRAQGFAIDFGPNGAGSIAKHLAREEGYYLDVGASQLIVDGKVKVKQGVEIDRFVEDGVVMADGTHLPADVVVMATGYAGPEATCRELIGSLADECVPVYQLGPDGELSGVWRPCGVEGLWFMLGSIQQSRFFSRLVALQIKAEIEGLKSLLAGGD